MNVKKILSLAIAFVMLLCIVNVPVFAQSTTEVANETQLVTALADGGNIKLTGNITTTKAITTAGVTATIDLNGKTLKIGAGDNKFNDASDITIKNGKIVITGVTVNGNAIFCLDEYEKTLVTTLTLDDVNLSGNGYSSAYGIFYIGTSSVLNVNGGVWNLSNDTFNAGGVFKADDSGATLNISGTEMTLHNVRRVVTYAATTIENSTIAISGDADGVDVEMEHGFNRSPLTIKSSIVTMKDMVGRGITAENGTVLVENSTVTMQNVQEATIDVRNNQTVSVDEASDVFVDAQPTIASGAISGNVTVADAESIPTGTLKVVYTSESKYWGECGGNARESFEFKFYNGATYMGYTSLNNIDNIIDGDVYVSWNIKLDAASNTDGYWTMAWEIAPTVAMQPNRVEQWVDGVKVAQCSINANSPDDLKPVFAAVTDNNGKILSYITRAYNADGSEALQNALSNSANVALIDDVKLNSTLVIPESATVTLDLNGKTLSGTFPKSEGHVIKNAGVLTVTNGTIKSTAENGGSAIGNTGTATVSNTTLNGAPNSGESWPSYTVNNSGIMEINNSKITSTHGAVASYGDDALLTLNNTDINMSGIKGFTSHAIYAYSNGKVIVNGGNIANNATDQNATGGSVINGAVTVTDGVFTGRVENYYGTPVISGGTFSVDVTKYLADGYELTKNEDGSYGVKFDVDSYLFKIQFAVINMAKAEDGDYRCAFVAGIDSLDYKEVGFKFYYNGEQFFETSTKTVYDSLAITSTSGNRNVYTAEQFGAGHLFYLGAQFPTSFDDKAIEYQPYAVTLDGEEIVGIKTELADVYTIDN